MGTRADFYVGRGEQAEWLGSIGWDGYPSGIPDTVLNAHHEAAYRAAVAAFFATRDDVTLPEQGWPWPWNDSRITDYAYAFDEGGVYYSYFGHDWHGRLTGQNRRSGLTNRPWCFQTCQNERTFAGIRDRG